MDAELKKLLESKIGQTMICCTTTEGVRSQNGNFEATLNSVIGDSNIIVIGDWVRVNMDHLIAFWFQAK